MLNIRESVYVPFFTAPPGFVLNNTRVVGFPLAAIEKLPLVTLELLGQTLKPQLFPPQLIFGLETGLSMSRL